MNTVIIAVLGNLGIQALVLQLVVGACLASILEGGLLGTQGEAFLAASAQTIPHFLVTAVNKSTALSIPHCQEPCFCLGQTSSYWLQE